MTQPRFAPITEQGEVRPAYHLAPPRPWAAHRAGEAAPTPFARRRGGGFPGPDQGYALLLVRELVPGLVLAPGEHVEDVVAGTLAVALRRAAAFGRAPVKPDLEAVLGAFGYLADAPAELVAARRRVFAGADHDYLAQRRLADLLPEHLLRLAPAQLAASTDAVLGALAVSVAARHGEGS